MSSVKILLATRNLGKINEFRYFFSKLPINLLSLRDFPDAEESQEQYLTFEENARDKAITAFKQTGLISLGDDSGLEVDALLGAPGIYSARFAGEKASDAQNNQKLLELLREVPLEKRSARFVCVLALALNEKKIKLVRAEVRGLILLEPRGSQGFGYDPLFYHPALGKSFAELSFEEKLKVSHRGKALRKLRPILKDLLRSLEGKE